MRGEGVCARVLMRQRACTLCQPLLEHGLHRWRLPPGAGPAAVIIEVYAGNTLPPAADAQQPLLQHRGWYAMQVRLEQGRAKGSSRTKAEVCARRVCRT